MANQQLTPSERAINFANNTRQNMHMLPKQHTNTGGDTLQFGLPRARLISKLILNVDVKCLIKHASGSDVPFDHFLPYRTLSRIALDLNNGFSPYVFSGEQACLYGHTLRMYDLYTPQDNEEAFCYMPTLKTSAEGIENHFNYTIELPVTLNDREPIGLILLQSPETNVTLTCSIGMPNDIIKNKDFSFEYTDLTISVMTETFSVPAMEHSFPDISVLKLVNGRQDAFLQNENIIKLNTGNIYRKLLLEFRDMDGIPLKDEDISNIELIFNQADINYSLSPKLLRKYNLIQYGHALPKGVYVFDFASMQGVVNMAGSRDMIDTAKLTEFWLRFNTPNKSGRVHIVSETLATISV